MSSDYDLERKKFDRVASAIVVEPLSKTNLERYASPRWPNLFPKEKMFSLAGDVRGKKILELGCGDGVEALQLAYCGADVTGLDLSEVSISVARQRASLQGFQINFRVDNIVENGSLGEESFDVVWCNLILHHVVDGLELVMPKIVQALKPGGMFISREPVAYARWLKALRGLVPVGSDTDDPNQQPFRDSEFLIVRKYFPDLCMRHYRILARADLITTNLSIIRMLARADNLLLLVPGSAALAGDIVMWARKKQ